MSIDKTRAIIALVWFIIGCVCGFFIGKAKYSQPLDTDIKRDTVTLWDTIPHWYPVPVDVKPQKPQYKWLTKVEHSTDTLLQHDSVLVEVPIESRHYHADEYDAWVSGFEPSLDSIRVYQRTAYVTEIRTISKPPNKWELDVVGGIDYNTAQDRYTPFAGGELMYKPSRLQLGIRGGVVKQGNKAEPQVGAVVKYRLF